MIEQLEWWQRMALRLTLAQLIVAHVAPGFLQPMGEVLPRLAVLDSGTVVLWFTITGWAGLVYKLRDRFRPDERHK